MGKTTQNPKCTKCWDKGFASQMVGPTTASGDFDGQRDCVLVPAHIKKNYCKCTKGRALKKKETT